MPDLAPRNPMPPRKRLLWSGLLLTGLLALLFLIPRAAAPQWLVPAGDARWLMAAKPIELWARKPQMRFNAFQTTLAGPLPGTAAPLTLRSLGRAEVFLNGQPLGRSQPWRGRLESLELDLRPWLLAGDNELRVVVGHAWGPPALLVDLEPLGRGRQKNAWLVSEDGQRWLPAKAASDAGTRPEHLTRWVAWQGLAANAGLIFLLAAVGALAAFGLSRWTPAGILANPARRLACWQGALLVGLASLFAWNFNRLPGDIGMDLVQHVQYVSFILKQGALPYADQGWQMFQPPLAYGLGALTELLRRQWWPEMPVELGLRLLTMACTLLTAAVACRICQRVFGATPTAAVAMGLAVFLPMSVYLGQTFGNEPFAALFGSLLVLEAGRLLTGGREAASLPAMLRIGLWLGLGLLAKPSVVLMLPGLLIVIAWRVHTPGGWRAMVSPLATVLGVAFVVAGWWYVRNLLRFGRPFVGGWEAGRGIDWWQYPGFRVPEHFLRFGEALVRPFYAGVDSFWDGIYATLWLDGNLSGMISQELQPAWNQSAMVGLALLALPIMLAILAALGRAIRLPGGEGERGLFAFAVAQFAFFLAAMLLVFAQVPAHSAAKGSYLAAVAACLPILFGFGIAPLMRTLAGRMAVSAFISVWIGLVIAGFAVR